jgi:pilus assembly protein Flp/PilA
VKKIIFNKEDSPMREMMKFLKDEEGQGMVEYGLIIGLIAVAVIAALGIMGPKVAALFNKVNETLPS